MRSALWIGLLVGCGSSEIVERDPDAAARDASPVDAGAGTCVDAPPELPDGLGAFEIVAGPFDGVAVVRAGTHGVYVADADGIWRVSGTPCDRALLADGWTHLVDVDDDGVYWHERGGIHRMAPDGAGRELLYPAGSADDLVAANGAVFVSSSGLIRIPTDGAPATTLVGPDVALAPYAITADATDAYYFVEGDSTLAAPYRVDPVDGSGATALSPTGTFDPRAVIAGASDLYWLADNRVWRMPRAGALQPEVLDWGLSFASNALLAQDQGALYYVDNEDTSTPAHAMLLRLDKSTWHRDVLGYFDGGFTGLAVRDDGLYTGIVFADGPTGMTWIVRDRRPSPPGT
jgi:hypothetical protein